MAIDDRPRRSAKSAPEEPRKAPVRPKKPAKSTKKATPAKAEVVDAEPEVEADEPEGDEPAVDELTVEALADAPDALAVEPEGDEPATAIVPVRASKGLVPSSGVAPTDLLQRYMAEVARHPLLTREEEISLAREYARTQDPKVAYRMVTANLRLVVKIAWEYRRAAFNLLDLIQEGNVGLMQGVRKFDPERNVKLSTYAAWWIRAYIIRYLMDNWRLVKLGTTQAQRKIFFNLRKEKDKLVRQGFDPEPKLLAKAMNVSEQDVMDMDRRMGSDDVSLDAPVNDDSSLNLGDRLEQGGMAVDDRLAEEQVTERFKRELAVFAKTLEGKEQYLFQHRLVADEPKTLQEVGDHYGISRERARQIEARLTQKLKAYMREHLPDFEHLTMEPPDE